jgi:YesN/AraC family two-component response regulator
VLTKLALRNQPVALIAADQRMPEMTGIEMLEQARTQAPGAKYLLLTAYADTDVAIKAINDIGLDYYLLKPWDPSEERLDPVIDDLLRDWRRATRTTRPICVWSGTGGPTAATKSRAGDRQGQAVSLINLGAIRRRQGSYDQALAYHQRSLTIFQELDDRNGQAEAFLPLADPHQRQGRHDQAIAYHQRASSFSGSWTPAPEPL